MPNSTNSHAAPESYWTAFPHGLRDLCDLVARIIAFSFNILRCARVSLRCARVRGAKPVAVRRAGSALGPGPAVRDGDLTGDAEPGPEVVPEAEVELGAGLGQVVEGIAAVAPDVAPGAAADLAPGDLGADVVLRSVGVQRDLRAVEHVQQLGLVGVQAVEQPVEHGEAGAALEDAVEAGAQLGPAAPTGLASVGLQVGVEPPDEITDARLGGPLLVGEGVELVDE